MPDRSNLRRPRNVLAGLVPPAYEQQLGHARFVERASDRTFRARNRISYRLNHWPIWIWTFFIAPGPLTFDLFAHGFDRRMAIWLGIVLAGTGVAGVFGKLPGVEAAPYIIRFTEDKPNPLYRRICYTFAWSAVVTFAKSTMWRTSRSPARYGCSDCLASFRACAHRPATRGTSGATSTAPLGPSALPNLRWVCSGSCCRRGARGRGSSSCGCDRAAPRNRKVARTPVYVVA